MNNNNNNNQYSAQVIETNSRTESGIEYLEAMKNIAVASLLPKSELTVFDGNSLRYFTILKSFENNVEKDTLDASRRLQLLIQFCTGKAKRLIEKCISMEPEEGYRTAKRLLAERFGDKYKFTKAWICKISDGPAVKPGDCEALLELADDLQSCKITLQATGRLMQINSEDKLVKVIGRCPGFVKSRWQSHILEIREEGTRDQGRRPSPTYCRYSTTCSQGCSREERPCVWRNNGQ